MADRNWPHPVLEHGGVDYPNRAFQVALKVNHVGSSYVIKAIMDVGSDTLLKEIEQGRAQYALKVHCPMTAYRRVTTATEKEIVATLPGAALLNGFYVQGFVVAMQKFDLQSDEFDEVFAGYSFPVTKGVVLAVGDEQEYDADKSADGLRHIRSMFRVIRSHKPDARPVALDLTQERVIIQLPSNDFDLYNAFKDQSPHKEGFVASIVFPALVQALMTLKRDGDDGSDVRWQLGLRRKLEEADLDVPDEDSVFDVAQKLLDYPVDKSLTAIDIKERAGDF